MPAPAVHPDAHTTSLLAQRDRIYAASQVLGEDGSVRSVWPEGLARNRGEALRDLVIREKVRRCIETGFAYAMSTSFLLEGVLANNPTATSAADPPVVSMDPFQTIHWKGAGRRHLKEAGASGLHRMYEERSEVVLPRLIAEGQGFDFAFIDGDHRFEYVFTDIFFARRLLGPGRLIVLDDEWMKSVRKCAAFYESARLCRREKTPRNSPLSKFILLRVEAAGDDRKWDHFARF